MTAVAIGIGIGVVVLMLAVFGIAMRRSRPLRIDTPEAAARAAEQAIGGFVVAGAVVGADGAGALAVSEDNRVAAIAPVKRHLVVREVGWNAVRATADGIEIETGDRRIGRVALAGVDVLDIRRLAPIGLSPAALAARGIAIGGLLDEIAAEEEAAGPAR